MFRLYIAETCSWLSPTDKVAFRFDLHCFYSQHFKFFTLQSLYDDGNGQDTILKTLVANPLKDLKGIKSSPAILQICLILLSLRRRWSAGKYRQTEKTETGMRNPILQFDGVVWRPYLHSSTAEQTASQYLHCFEVAGSIFYPWIREWHRMCGCMLQTITFPAELSCPTSNIRN